MERKEDSNLKDNSDNSISSQKIEEEYGMDELNKGSFENELVNKSLLIMKTKDMCTQTKKKVQIGWTI